MTKATRIMVYVFAIAVLSATCQAFEHLAPPNVILVLTDDLGYRDLGCYGATKVQTSNIDRLAAEGRRYTDAHSVSAVCTPSRYALLIGEYPLRANGGKGLWGPAPVAARPAALVASRKPLSKFTDASMADTQEKSVRSLKALYTPAIGLDPQTGVMRRDPSDIIKVGDLYYVWYSKGKIAPGYDATVWYATSPDGHTWTEQGMALAKGEPGSWEGASVFTPNILVAEGRYWLFYTGTSRNFSKPFNPDSKIGIAVSNSPDGPWERLATNPALKNSDKQKDFDSHLVDDACLVVREGKYWLFYKGRQLGKSPTQTKLGVAVADRPQGPYVKHEGNPVLPGNHEVLVWPQGKGVAVMIGTTGPKEITRSIMYAEDGLHFSKTHTVIDVPHAAGAYRPEAFTDSGTGKRIEWGVHIGKQSGSLPFIQRFDLVEAE